MRSFFFFFFELKENRLVLTLDCDIPTPRVHPCAPSVALAWLHALCPWHACRLKAKLALALEEGNAGFHVE